MSRACIASLCPSPLSTVLVALLAAAAAPPVYARGPADRDGRAEIFQYDRTDETDETDEGYPPSLAGDPVDNLLAVTALSAAAAGATALSGGILIFGWVAAVGTANIGLQLTPTVLLHGSVLSIVALPTAGIVLTAAFLDVGALKMLPAAILGSMAAVQGCAAGALAGVVIALLYVIPPPLGASSLNLPSETMGNVASLTIVGTSVAVGATGAAIATGVGYLLGWGAAAGIDAIRE